MLRHIDLCFDISLFLLAKNDMAQTDKFRKAKSLFSTTLVSDIGTGTGDTITLNSTTGLPTDTEITLTFNRVDGNGTEQASSEVERITGTISGSTLTSYTRGIDNTTEQAHTAGTVIEYVWNADDLNDIIDGILVEHRQDGTHKKVTGMTNNTFVTADNNAGDGEVNMWKVDTNDRMVAGAGFTADGTYIIDEDDMSSDSATALATQQSIKAYVDSISLATDGWISYTAVVPTRSVSDDPTYEITFAGVDLTSTLSAGMRMKFTQDGTVRYFIITKVALDGSDTDVTLYGGTDYDVGDTASLTISALSYSTHKAPQGFPLAREKWVLEVADTSNRNASASATWTNLGSVSIAVPIGSWNLYYHVNAQFDASGATGTQEGEVTLSTANNSESDDELTSTLYAKTNDTNITTYVRAGLTRNKEITVASKTSYYLNTRRSDATSGTMYNRGDISSTIIRAVCAYL